jgi:peptide/nickel transport system substrate-binding protein
MKRTLLAVSISVALGITTFAAGDALAQKQGGVLKVTLRDNPPSASIHEEATNTVVTPYMAVYNNLVIFDQHIERNSLDTIVPDLAESWSWNDDYTKLTFQLREGVKWHDGEPFTAADVKHTWELVTGKGEDRLRRNPRRIWYHNLEEVTVDNDFQATFHLKRPQPSFIALLASGYSPVYPSHVSARDMRSHPIGTGPFRFVDFRRGEFIKLEHNPDYWKEGRPYLDAIEHTIITSRSTRILAFISRDFDMTFNQDVTLPLKADVESQRADAVCKVTPSGVTINLIVNSEEPPFDDENIRRAMMLTLDRSAFNDILYQGQAGIAGANLPPPAGVWGLPPERLVKVPGYGESVEQEREQAREIMRGLGYGPNKLLPVTVATRDIAVYRDPAVILVDHLREIYVDAQVEVIETGQWHAKVARRDYMVGLNLTGLGVDDPDANFFENYACDSERNYTGYCNPELEELFNVQMSELDHDKRLALVHDIDEKLQLDGARPIITHNVGATCWAGDLGGFDTMVNSIYNGWRMEDAWLDR